MQTRLTEMLGIEHPVMLAGMGGVSYAPLAAAVSEAGGLGTLGASTMGADQMVEQIAAVAAATDKPFGVDLLTAAPQDMGAKVRAIADGGGSVFVAGLGVPGEVIDLCHDLGIVVASMCGKVAHALRAVDAGCDLVVAQGTEAGGHTGQIATMALVPQVVDAVGDRAPVVAAGGIFDGRGLAAALALGAVGVWVGTRFIATPEAQAVAGYKERILASAEDGTLITKAYTGKTCRVLRTAYAREFEEAGGVPEPFPMQVVRSMEDGANHLGGDEGTPGVDPDREFMPAGQAIGAIDELVPAGDLVRSMVAEAEAVLERIG
ncbi:NAD(P)H-dependent flavin oxidoreductase [Dermatobacter hominis]|uniref:NAD(P)H-dependent flavin oxidoreductase n=1 Tax=Dermatobacter hominis TaxID=2884263 RepID=UPI001D108992|nr:nitronate monooxygenase family protein [Dermatobacter hominis]UDY36942.1 nitronate monooxygenase family protein [Dermatobacter hominis]